MARPEPATRPVHHPGKYRTGNPHEENNIDKIIHVVTEEQTSFFATTFKVEELTDSKRYAGKQKHLVYG